MKYLWIFIICCAANAVRAERRSDDFCDSYHEDDLAVLFKFFFSNVNMIVSGFEQMRKRLDDLSKRQTEQSAQLSTLLDMVTKLTQGGQLQNSEKPPEKSKQETINTSTQQLCSNGLCFQTTSDDDDDVDDTHIHSYEADNEDDSGYEYSFYVQ